VGLVDTFTRHTISSYYLSTILEALERKTRSFGCNTVLIPADQILHQLSSFGNSSLLKHLEGVIWMEPIFTNAISEAVRAAGVPCVVINNCEEDVDIDVVMSDNRSSSRQAVEYLLNLGHRSIGFVGGWLHLSNHKDRFIGYRERIAEAGIDARDDWIIDDITLWNDEGGAEGLHRLLGRRNRPTAVILCSDYLAVGAYRAAAEMGVDIPGDLSVISFDDFPLAQFMTPPLTTFRQPLQEIGECAALRLAALMSGGERRSGERQYLRCPLIVRRSVREISDGGRGAMDATFAPKEESMS
jgi:DNA-binding LacI/PurR family transcriptional regulator